MPEKSEFEYKGYRVEVVSSGFRRYLLILGQKYSVDSMTIPEEEAKKLIDVWSDKNERKS